MVAEKRTVVQEYESQMEHDKWREEIPSLQFDPDWYVKIIPPFGGTVVRFAIESESGKSVSVYLDCYDNLGLMGKPYWEVYDGNEPVRFYMEETIKLMDYIKEVLNGNS